MPEETRAATGASDGVTVSAAVAFLNSLAIVFSHSSVYGESHSVTGSMVQKSYDIISRALEERESVTITVVEDQFHVDGEPARNPTPALVVLIGRLTLLGVTNFTLVRGISRDEFGSFVEILHSSAEDMKSAGGLAHVIELLGISNVRAKKVILKQISEDEVVLPRERVEKAFGEGDTDRIVAFLKGEAGPDTEAVAERLQESVPDGATLGRHMVRAATSGEGVSEAEAVDILIDSVKRLYSSVSLNPKTQTQRGRKDLLKLIEEVSDQVLADLRERAGGTETESVRRLADVVEQTEDQLRIESLAAEYVRKRSAIEASEKRIVRFMKAHGGESIEDSDLMRRLLDSGLSVEYLEDLLAKSCAGRAEAAATGDRSLSREDVDNAQRIAAALAESVARLAAAGSAIGDAGAAVTTEQLDGIVVQVGQGVADVAAHAERRVLEFVEEVRNPKAQERTRGMSRRAILSFLAELGREIRQPLSVLECCLSMILSGRLGTMTAQQEKMIQLSEQSVQRVKLMADKVVELSVPPAELTPGQKILGATCGR